MHSGENRRGRSAGPVEVGVHRVFVACDPLVQVGQGVRQFVGLRFGARGRVCRLGGRVGSLWVVHLFTTGFPRATVPG